MSVPAIWASASRVLCIRLDTIGDVLMTTPAIRAVRNGHPGRQVTLLTSAPGAAIAALVPEVDETIVYDAPWLKATARRLDAAPDFAMIERLRAGRFDAAVIFTVFSQSALPAALLCHLADIPLRVAHARENPYQLLTTWVKETEPEQGIRHEVERQLALVEAVGYRADDRRLSLRVPGEARERVRRWLGAHGLDAGAPFIVLHPGATAASRRYPPPLFAAAARRLVAETGCVVLVTGDAGERALVEEVSASIGAAARPLAGRFGLADLAALIEAAPLLLTNNTGPAHVAAAVGTPVVDLYALTNPQHTPWMVPSRVLNHDVPCRNCFRSICPEGHNDCLRLVSPDAVAAACLELLASADGGWRTEATLEASRGRVRPPSAPRRPPERPSVSI